MYTETTAVSGSGGERGDEGGTRRRTSVMRAMSCLVWPKKVKKGCYTLSDGI